MFATILRRWRLSAPLALISMVSILVGAMALTPASAHGDKPVTFSGWAAGALAHLDTPGMATAANLQACFTGKVSKHGSSDLRVFAGEPVVLIAGIAQSQGDFAEKVIQFTKCLAEVKSKLTGDGTGSVKASATVIGEGSRPSPFGRTTPGINVADIFAPPFTADLVSIPGTDVTPAILSTDAEAFCKVEGTAKAKPSAFFSSVGNVILTSSTASGVPTTTNNFLGIFNQPLVGLPAGVSATLFEESHTVSGDFASETVIGLHIFTTNPSFLGHVDVKLAVSHANIKCPK